MTLTTLTPAEHFRKSTASRDALIAKWLAEGLAVKVIAARLGCGRTTVVRRRAKLGLPSNWGGANHRDQVAAWIDEGVTVTEIAARLGVARRTVQRRRAQEARKSGQLLTPKASPKAPAPKQPKTEELYLARLKAEDDRGFVCREIVNGRTVEIAWRWAA